MRPEQVASKRIEVVRPRLDAHQQRVETGDVDPARVVAGLETLDERRAGAGERVDHPPTRLDVPVEQRLHQLRDELAEVRVQTVDVLRSLALGKLRLRPGEVEVDVA